MDIIQINKKYIKLKEQTETTKETLCEEINKIIKPLFKATVSDCNNISVNIRTLDKDLYHYLRNIECIEIWETGKGDSEHAIYFVFPVSFLKINNTKKLIQKNTELYKNWNIEIKKEEKAQIKKFNDKTDKNEKKELKRLIKKYKIK